MMRMKRKSLLLISIVIIGTLITARSASAATLLRVGSYGSEVRTLQTKLTTLGYNTGTIDGIFGQNTKYAVMGFQKNYGLQADGIVGPITGQAIDRAYARLQTTNGIISVSKSLIGVPYAWGGTTPAGFDCSGFTGYVFAKQGITLPRMSRDQYNVGTPVAFSSLKPGDLVFFSLAGNGQVSHVGIYLGNGQFISSTSSKGVTISSFSTSYWMNAYVGAKRVY
jgi:cell wall-associated NlpC family hydrolase